MNSSLPTIHVRVSALDKLCAQWIQTRKENKSPSEEYQQQKAAIQSSMAEEENHLFSDVATEQSRRAALNKYRAYTEELTKLEMNHDQTSAMKELAYQQMLETQLGNFCTDALSFIGNFQPSSDARFESIRRSPPQPPITMLSHSDESMIMDEPFSLEDEEPQNSKNDEQPTLCVDAVRDRTSSEQQQQADEDIGQERKRKAADSDNPLQPESKQARTGEPEASLQETRNVTEDCITARSSNSPITLPTSVPQQGQLKTIEFDDVYQNAAAEYKHFIVKFPEQEGKWYILRCDEHGVHFHENALLGASRHLRGSQHRLDSANFATTISKLGVEVLNCTPELVVNNNTVVRQNFKDGYKPFNENKSRGALSKPSSSSIAGSKGSASRMSRGSRKHSAKHADVARRLLRGDGGVVNATPGEVYIGFWAKSKSFHGVLILPTGDFESIGLPGTIADTGLLEDIPQCYRYNLHTKKILGWQHSYEDGAPMVCHRQFPVMYFDGLPFPEQSAVGWMMAKDLSVFDPGGASVGHVAHIKIITDFLATRSRLEMGESHLNVGNTSVNFQGAGKRDVQEPLISEAVTVATAENSSSHVTRDLYQAGVQDAETNMDSLDDSLSLDIPVLEEDPSYLLLDRDNSTEHVELPQEAQFCQSFDGATSSDPLDSTIASTDTAIPHPGLPQLNETSTWPGDIPGDLVPPEIENKTPEAEPQAQQQLPRSLDDDNQTNQEHIYSGAADFAQHALHVLDKSAKLMEAAINLQANPSAPSEGQNINTVKVRTEPSKSTQQSDVRLQQPTRIRQIAAKPSHEQSNFTQQPYIEQQFPPSSSFVSPISPPEPVPNAQESPHFQHPRGMAIEPESSNTYYEPCREACCNAAPTNPDMHYQRAPFPDVTLPPIQTMASDWHPTEYTGPPPQVTHSTSVTPRNQHLATQTSPTVYNQARVQPTASQPWPSEARPPHSSDSLQELRPSFSRQDLGADYGYSSPCPRCDQCFPNMGDLQSHFNQSHVAGNGTNPAIYLTSRMSTQAQY